MLSDRFSGAQAINLRHQPIPWAYRVFYRHIGLDPDEQRTPVEELALERMKHGGFRSNNLLDDALTIAIIESGRRDARLRRRSGHRAGSGSGSARQARSWRAGPASSRRDAGDRRRRAPAGAVVRRPGGRPGGDPKTKRTTLVAIGVSGVPAIAVEEALWLAAGVMRG